MYNYEEKHKRLILLKQYPYLILALINLKEKDSEKYNAQNGTRQLTMDIMKTPEWEFSIKYPYDDYAKLSYETMYMWIYETRRSGTLDSNNLKFTLLENIKKMFKEDKRSNLIYSTFPGLIEFVNSNQNKECESNNDKTSTPNDDKPSSPNDDKTSSPTNNEQRLKKNYISNIVNPSNTTYTSIYELSKYASSEFTKLNDKIDNIFERVNTLNESVNNVRNDILELKSREKPEKPEKPKRTLKEPKVRKPRGKSGVVPYSRKIEYCKCVRKTRSNVSKKKFCLCKICDIKFHTSCYRIQTTEPEFICEYCE